MNNFQHLLCTLILIGCSISTSAQEILYRYIDNNGLTVISSQIPAEFVAKGYDIISSNGRLVKTIPPEPSTEEKQRILRELEEAKRLKELRRRYSSVDDIKAAKQRKLAQSKNDIGIIERNIEKINSEIDRLQSLAAADERAGRKVKQSTLDGIAQLKVDRLKEQKNKADKEKEIVDLTERFNSDIKHFRSYTQ